MHAQRSRRQHDRVLLRSGRLRDGPGGLGHEPETAGPGGARKTSFAYLASFAAGDPDAIAAHVAADFVNEHASALGRGSTGAAEYRSRLPGFLASLPGLRYDVESVIADGARVAVEYRLTATSDGHPIDVRGVMVVEVSEA